MNTDNIIQKIANLSPEKRALLELKLKNKTNKNIDPPSSQIVSKREICTNIPLSFSQQRLWFLDQLEPNTPYYNISRAFRLDGGLNIQILQQALNTIVIHHETLRTTYISENGNVTQVINAPRSVELQTIDLQQHGASEQQNNIQQWLKQESQRPFSLDSDLMIRGSLLQLNPQEQILQIVVHHIATDGWSMGIFWEQLTQLYQAFLNGQPNPLATLSIQYADFAIWQREWLSGDVLDRELKYWQKQLAGANPLLELPYDRPRQAVQTHCGKTQSYTLPQHLSVSLQEFCRRQGVTLYMTLLATFQVLLYRYTGQEDIIIGSPIAGRNRIELENLMGFFVNTLVLRTNLSGNPSFQELLARVRSVTLDAYDHQDLPIEKIIEALNVERSLSYSLLFQVMFVLQNTPNQSEQILGFAKNPIDLKSEIANFDFTLWVEEKDGAIITLWQYNTDLFNEDTIERMRGHFQSLLEAIITNPDQSISTLPLLSAKEQQLLVDWNQTKVAYPSHKFIHQLFEEQVEKTPKAIAVAFEQQQLTYRELNAKANQLAHYLRSQNVTIDQFVGISVERSLEMIVAILGVLKAGAAYIPLDPAYPSDRLAYMIADANISVLLTQNKWRSQLPDHQAKVICLDSDWEKIGTYSPENPSNPNTGENLAYVIYTSGSTGKPKGVMISHQALSIFTQTVISEYQITECDRVLQFASINFDAAVEEIYPSLCTGATLVLRTDAMLADLCTFFQACENLKLTVLDLPTAYWHQLAADLANNISLPESLRLVIIGGEKVLSEPVKSWQQYVVKSGKGDRLQLINTYGPTETTVSTTLYRIPNTNTINGEIPIGRPLAHLQTYILDPHLQPVPIGVSGELHIGGDSLAKGYLNLPDLTAEKFVPNPFGIGRLYKTGDLARYLADGNIEFLGRIDNQVKIRGFRIELGEIESVLSQHPNVRAVVITTREDSSNKRLVAYIVAEQAQPQIIDLRAFLQERLPDYMMPSAFVFLECIPITPNGKIDYHNLPAPDASSIQLETEFISPSNPTEESLANIWADVLGLKRVGIHDNFFDLGGHSLLAIQVISRCRQAFSVEIPLKILFEQPTIAKLSDRIKTLVWLAEGPQANIDFQKNEIDEIEEFEL